MGQHLSIEFKTEKVVYSGIRSWFGVDRLEVYFLACLVLSNPCLISHTQISGAQFAIRKHNFEPTSFTKGEAHQIFQTMRG